ncbi:phage tail protein [Serratia rubidaea]|uniref:Phage tail protein n=1 Tax=Serratia rubidaea TaxID=61652 RepID=A0ABS0MCR8_SERRU|nr:phage tail protein [Serratia rubidaea]MBH1930158.1 phage tail protein [Serratia rubidaea]MDC6120541.1 phage tail protein [Serratia rubidaea]MEB7588400.1 phage tail protein [Serratia rubidaea]HDJ1438062.1 phage tail protein [Serratia rubidaea]HDJ1446936.1 phage tail protein [Serratia rubidaea]
MNTKFIAILTNQGAAKLANATALGTQLEITQMAVGDGGGTLPTPNPEQTALVAEKRRALLNSLSVDANNSAQIIAEQIIPENEGGWWIREIGLFDNEDTLVAIANCPETYKPQLQEGSGRTQTIRMALIVSSSDAVTLKIDPAVVLATRAYVDDEIQKHAKTRNHPDASLADKGFVQLSNATDSTDDTLAATPKAIKTVNDDVAKRLLRTDMPVGIPLPWPTDTPPAGWLKCNGATFNKTKYPLLAQAYPTLQLPDLRGEFIRGWDDGRGVDAERSLLSWQKGSYLLQEAAPTIDRVVQFSTNDLTLLGWDKTKANGDICRAKTTSNATTGTWAPEPTGADGVQYLGYSRPRNIAFNYIVRAA